MLDKVTFAMARPETKTAFTHFIGEKGDVTAIEPLETVTHAKVGIIKDFDFPHEWQVEQIIIMARQAMFVNPTVTLVFEEGTSPFEPWITENTLGWDKLVAK